MNGGFPMQQGMGGDMNAFNGSQNGGHGPGEGGRGRGRGRGAANGRGRGRGGQPSNSGGHTESSSAATISAPSHSEAAQTPTVAAPTPVLAAPSPVVANTTGRDGFVPPERPQSPTLCKFGLKCTNPVCRWSHPSPVATPESGVVLSNDPCENGKNCKDKDCIKAHVSPAVLNPSASASEHVKPSAFVPPAPPAQNQTPCRFGNACTRPGCAFLHPNRPQAQACRFGTACTKASCPYQHPEGRVLPSSFHRGLSTTGGMVSVKAPETGTMNAHSQNKSMTFNKSAGPGSAADLERRLKEMEEKKSQAEAALAAASAGKKEVAAA